MAKAGMRVGWLQDLDPFVNGGGAQMSDRTLIMAGLRQGHDISLAVGGDTGFLQQELDALVLCNITAFPWEALHAVAASPVPYVLHIHDYFCVAKGQLVYCNGVPAPIEDVRVGDVVLGSTGEALVTQAYAKPYKGKVQVLRALGGLPARLTPEHRVLVLDGATVRGERHRNTWRRSQGGRGLMTLEPEPLTAARAEWRRADQVRVGDFVLLPVVSEEAEYTIDLNPFIAPYAAQRGWRHDPVRVDDEVAWFLGRFLADGSATTKSCNISFGMDEGADARRCAMAYQRITGRVPGIIQGTGNSLVLRAPSTPLARFLADSFGTGARNKRIPAWVQSLPKGQLSAFLDGYCTGDGNPNANGSLHYATVSPFIAQGLALAFAKFGVAASVHALNVEGKTTLIRGKPCVSHGTRYDIVLGPGQATALYGGAVDESSKRWCVEIDGRIWVPVRGITEEDYDGFVYDIATSSEDFAAPFIVHNCKHRLFYPMADKCKGCYLRERWLPFLTNARLRIFLSPLHRRAWEFAFPELRGLKNVNSPPPVDPAVFYDRGGPRSGAIAVNAHLPFKGRDLFLAWAKAHPDVPITLVGAEADPTFPANVHALGPVPYEAMAELYNQHTTFLHLASHAMPYDRTCAEAYLSGCAIHSNGLVGALSWPFFKQGRAAVARASARAPAQFWRAVEEAVRP